MFQYLYNYLKTNMSSPLEKNILEDTQKKYEEMYNILKKGDNNKNVFESSKKHEIDTEYISMDSMKEELLKYIETLE